MRNAYKILIGKREGKRPPCRPRHRWEDNIQMNLKTGYELDPCASRKGPVAGSCEDDKEISVSIKGGEFLN
jgi:hypothetical protein